MRQLGPLALGSRLKRLSDRLMQDGIRVYRHCGIDFEPKWFPVYYFLAERGPSAVMDIARGIGITHPSVNQIAKEMIGRGYVASYKDPKDKRKRVLALSSEGKALREPLSRIWQQIETVLAELIAESGVDFLMHMETLERSLTKRSFLSRFEAGYAHPNSPFQIRTYDPALKHRFIEINERWINAYFEMEDTDRLALEDVEGKILEPGGEIVFAINEQGDVVGTCALIHHDKETAELAKMGVDPDAQSAGAGKAMGLRIIELAREKGYQKLILETNARLTPAIGLYQRLGFEVRPFPRPSDYQRADVYMELMLDPAR